MELVNDNNTFTLKNVRHEIRCKYYQKLVKIVLKI